MEKTRSFFNKTLDSKDIYNLYSFDKRLEEMNSLINKIEEKQILSTLYPEEIIGIKNPSLKFTIDGKKIICSVCITLFIEESSKISYKMSFDHNGRYLECSSIENQKNVGIENLSEEDLTLFNCDLISRIQSNWEDVKRIAKENNLIDSFSPFAITPYSDLDILVDVIVYRENGLLKYVIIPKRKIDDRVNDEITSLGTEHLFIDPEEFIDSFLALERNLDKIAESYGISDKNDGEPRYYHKNIPLRVKCPIAYKLIKKVKRRANKNNKRL